VSTSSADIAETLQNHAEEIRAALAVYRRLTGQGEREGLAKGAGQALERLNADWGLFLLKRAEETKHGQ
jgi:hypothetical protein